MTAGSELAVHSFLRIEKISFRHVFGWVCRGLSGLLGIVAPDVRSIFTSATDYHARLEFRDRTMLLVEGSPNRAAVDNIFESLILKSVLDFPASGIALSGPSDRVCGHGGWVFQLYKIAGERPICCALAAAIFAAADSERLSAPFALE